MPEAWQKSHLPEVSDSGVENKREVA